MRPAFTFLGVVVGIALVFGMSIRLMAADDYPGGMSLGYPVTYYDRRMTDIAREAIPIIAALNGFYGRHGQCPRPGIPGELTELRTGLRGFVATRQGQFVEISSPEMITGWVYYVFADPGSCTLSRKLGWDPDLMWSRSRAGAQWIFVPGDGSDEKPTRLDPASPARR